MEISEYNKIAESERLITRVLASINIPKDELDAMLRVYRETKIKKIKVEEEARGKNGKKATENIYDPS